MSFRDVEDLLAQRGITVSYEAIRLWCIQFGSEYARRLKRRQGRLGDTWHLDEVFVTILPPRCNVVPASATYGRLMPRGAGFCYVFTALSSSDSRHFHRLPRSGVRCQAVSICTGSCTRITRAASRNQRCLGFRWRMAKFEPRSDNKCSLSASRCRGADGRTGTAAAAEVGLRFSGWERGPGPADRGWGSSVRGWRQRRADDLYLYGGGLTPELAELVKRTFRGVHLLTYLKREELVELGRENKLDGAAEAARIAQDETLGTDTSETGI